MEKEMICIPKKKYEKLVKIKKIDQELLNDIALGVKDILHGKIREV